MMLKKKEFVGYYDNYNDLRKKFIKKIRKGMVENPPIEYYKVDTEKLRKKLIKKLKKRSS